MNACTPSSVLCLHGALGTGRMWTPIRDRLSAMGNGTADWCMPDLPGHGPDGALICAASTFDDIADSFLDTLSLHPPRFIVGYSLGARLALSMICRHPAFFAGAVLIGVHPGLSTEAERRARHLDEEARLDILAQQGLAAFVRIWEQNSIFDSQQSLTAELLLRQREMRTAHCATSLLSALRALSLSRQPDYRARLAKIRLPILFVAGAQDEKFSAIARDLAALSPMFAWTPVSRAGHNTVIENPDETAGLISQFHERIRKTA